MSKAHHNAHTAPFPDAPRVTLQRVAQALGCSIATVSRLRAGDRQPSFLLMVAIERAFDWPLEEQARSRAASRWHLDFDTALNRYYTTQPDVSDVNTEKE